MRPDSLQRARRALVGCAGAVLWCLCAGAATEQWVFEVDGRLFHTKPVVRDDRLYFLHREDERGTSARTVCLDTATGKAVWTIGDSDGACTPPRFGDGRLFMYSDLSGVRCLDARTGERLWQFTEPRYPTRTTMCAGEGRFIVSDRRRYYCVDAATGKEVWRRRSGDIRVRPIISDGRAYLLSTPSRDVWRAHAVDIGTGRVFWEVDLMRGSWRVPRQMALHEKRLCILQSGHIICLDASDGKNLWRIESHTVAPPTFARGNILLTWRDLIAVDAATGERRWVFSGPAQPRSLCGNMQWFFGQPVPADGRIFSSHRDGNLYCVDAATGNQLWKKRFLNPIGPPQIDGDTVVVADNNYRDIHGREPVGRLVALDRATGHEAWRWERDGAHLRHMAAADGRFFVVVSDHGIVCIASGARSR